MGSCRETLAVLLHLSDLELITVMEAFKGKYERTSAENYEELLKLFEVNFLLRKAATASNPVVEISEEGGEWTIKQSTTLKTVILKFKLGEEFDETTPDGREVKTVLTFEDGKLITVQTAKKEGVKNTKSTREIVGEELVYTITVDGCDLISTQKFKRV